MSKRKIFYNWWKNNRKHQSGEIIYSSYRKIDNEIKYMIRESKKENFINNYNKAENLQDKWNLLHNFGITSKARKNEARDIKFGNEFTLDKLNEHFTKLKPLENINLHLEKSLHRFNFKVISPQDVIEIFSKIKSKATGPDGIPPKCFKLLSKYIAEPISIIINLSFATGYFPKKLQQISVTQLPKVDDPKSLSQFRPISNANYLLKVISTISCQQFTDYIENNQLLSEHQSGFRRNHSCTTAILKLTEDLHKSISNGKCVILVLIDFSNAFGSVDHNKLIQVLKSVGVDKCSMNWFKSFLNGWHQVVKHNEQSSKPREINREIIQGENNSQLLFSIFINNITKFIKTCNVVMFADDVQIYFECNINAIEDGIKTMNDELKNIENFCNDYGIDINPLKSNALIISSKNNLKKLNYDELSNITVNDQKIEYVDSVRDLGYYLNRTLTSETHVKNVQQKVYRAINTLNPLKMILPTEIKLQLIKSLIIPIFDYMDIIYHNYGVHETIGEADKLERLQNICIRYVLNVNRREHITPYRNELNLLKLFDRRILHIGNILNKIILSESPPYLSHLINVNKNNTRSLNKLIVNMPKNNFHKTSLFIGAPGVWNNIPEPIRNVDSCDEFKNEFKKYLLNENLNIH